MTSETLVTYADGTVRGVRTGGLVAWRGIPFAAPPVGDLRWRAPQPVDPWPGVRDATRFGDAAPQHPRMLVTGRDNRVVASENCLTLNVVAPAGHPHTPRPVLVFVHGGAYTMGTTAMPLYGGGSLVRGGDVVYVSVNYRLGPLGFLDVSEFSTPDRPFDSNLGLRDQVAALRWVQRNIAAFGGDPANVTIFGESAGGTSVTTLMATPAAAGLFARGIAQSPAPSLVGDADRARRAGRRFVELLAGDTGAAVAALSSATPAELGRTGARLSRELPGGYTFGPVVDGDLLPADPLVAFTDGTAHRVPLIIGTNLREGELFTRFLDALPTNERRIERMFATVDPDARDRVVAAYPGYPAERAAVDLGGDVTFWYPSLLIAQAHSRYAPTFAYRFDFAPRLLHWAGVGATHAVDLLAVFAQADETMGRLLTAAGGRRGLRTVTEAMQRHWLRFAHDGEPLPSWPRYDTADRATMVFDVPTRIEHDPQRDRRLAWEGYRGFAVAPTVTSTP